jgi:hypothetical protein
MQNLKISTHGQFNEGMLIGKLAVAQNYRYSLTLILQAVGLITRRILAGISLSSINSLALDGDFANYLENLKASELKKH